MWTGVYFTLAEYFFTSLFAKTLCFSAQETTQKLRQMHMLTKTMSESPPPSHAFSEFITYQISMENDETKYKSRDN